MSEPLLSLFDQLYQQYKGMVYQLCTGFMKGDRELADDLVQEIFINTWHALPKYRGEAAYKTWIYRIAVNTCLQYIRKNKGKQAESLPEEWPGSQEAATSSKEELYQRLYRAIGQLDTTDRLIIMMVLDELAYEEVSQVTGISEATLRVKIHRIKQRLKKIMDHEYRHE